MFRRHKLSETQVQDALKTVRYPGYSRDIVSFGMVKGLQLQGQDVTVVLEVTATQPEIGAQIRQDTETALRALPGVGRVHVDMRLKMQEAARGHEHEHEHGHGHGHAQHAGPHPQPIAGISNIVAVASGKGGVGKSTVATNLAVALGMAGLRTGLLDADIYGPSIPLMMGVHGKPQISADNRIIPLVNHGIKIQSLGFFLGENAPVIWRGPMVMKAVQQLLQDTDWGELDVLVIDLPPGTGDVQLTLVQTVPLTGAVLVTTPQDLALLDVKKAAEMFKTVNAPLLGVVENMSFFVCSDCGKVTEIFRRGGGEKESERLGIPLLGRVPLDPIVCDAGDTGAPVTIAQPDTEVGMEFQRIAAALVNVLHTQPRQTPLKIIN